ncbi:MAG: hypothetical protein FRX49_07118 [Trebouxia sp. A1-2]|nr:MAG: hypothetical protein FRX49_07118 [Trebouxia sp. A1-2]
MPSSHGYNKDLRDTHKAKTGGKKMNRQGQQHDACAQQCFQWATSDTLVKSEAYTASQAKT